MAPSSVINVAGDLLRTARPKQIVLSGPSGFLGSRVLESILGVHKWRKSQGMEPGETVLLSSSPGNLMSRLTARYGSDALSAVRASRVDYYHQHQVWLLVPCPLVRALSSFKLERTKFEKDKHLSGNENRCVEASHLTPRPK
eukprot:159240-Pyramimonas_sp.AAC.2